MAKKIISIISLLLMVLSVGAVNLSSINDSLTVKDLLNQSNFTINDTIDNKTINNSLAELNLTVNNTIKDVLNATNTSLDNFTTTTTTTSTTTTTLNNKILNDTFVEDIIDKPKKTIDLSKIVEKQEKELNKINKKLKKKDSDKIKQKFKEEATKKGYDIVDVDLLPTNVKDYTGKHIIIQMTKKDGGSVNVIISENQYKQKYGQGVVFS